LRFRWPRHKYVQRTDCGEHEDGAYRRFPEKSFILDPDATRRSKALSPYPQLAEPRKNCPVVVICARARPVPGTLRAARKGVSRAALCSFAFLGSVHVVSSDCYRTRVNRTGSAALVLSAFSYRYCALMKIESVIRGLAVARIEVCPGRALRSAWSEAERKKALPEAGKATLEAS
jgi:hypothetical protein